MAFEYTELFKKLHSDPEFRRKFTEDPAAVLREAGVDPENLNLPSKIDADTLEQRLQDVFEHGKEPAIPGEEHKDLSPDELWDQFQVIGSKEGSGTSPAAAAAAVVALVVYGGPPVVAVNVVTAAGAAGGFSSEDDEEA